MAAADHSYLFRFSEIAEQDNCGEEQCVPGSAPIRLVGIAKLAAEGDKLRQGHNVEYFTLESRSILNRCTAPRMPFTWTINPYRGCEFACKYCYARYTHEFLEIRDNIEFERKIFLKQAAGLEPKAGEPGAGYGRRPGDGLQELLRRDLKKVKPGEEIAIGTATDPYQPAERRFGLTRTILAELAQHRGFEIGIVTKSDLVMRDIDLFQRIAEHNSLFINLTITTLDAQLARILEPRAPRPDLRMNAVKELNAAGIDAGVICAPVVPGITDSVQSLDALVRETKHAGGKYIFANPLFLKPCSASVFLPFLDKEFPKLAEGYRKRYEGKAFVEKAYKRRISDLMKALRTKYNVRWESRRDQERARKLKEHPDAAQMGLFYELSPPEEKPELPLGYQRRRRSMC